MLVPLRNPTLYAALVELLAFVTPPDVPEALPVTFPVSGPEKADAVTVPVLSVA